jgi:hypothetical protein
MVDSWFGQWLMMIGRKRLAKKFDAETSNASLRKEELQDQPQKRKALPAYRLTIRRLSNQLWTIH